MPRLKLANSGDLIIEDNFNGNDNDLLHGRTPDTKNSPGTTWRKGNTYDLTIIGNNLETNGFTDDENIYKENDHYIETGNQDLTIESTMDCAKSGSEIILQNILLRYKDFENHYSIQLGYIGNIIQTLLIRETLNNQADTKATYVPDPAHDGSAVTIKAVDTGEAITVYYNGILAATFSTTVFNNSTLVGIKGNDYNDQIWQNFKVWKT